MRYTLRQLQVFLAAAHFQNISRAAESLSMSQSAASGALKEFEGQFDVQFFDRVGKRLQLNELGVLIRPQAQALMEQAFALETSLKKHIDVGAIKVGATLTIGNYLAVSLLNRFMDEQPGAKVDLDIGNTDEISHKVLNFEIDVGLIEGEFWHQDLEITPWREDDLVVFCAADHEYAKKYELSDADVLSAKWILRETGSGTRQTFDRAMSGLVPSLNVQLELQHTEAIKQAVKQGMGISCLPNVALEEDFKLGTLKPLAVPGRNLHRTFYIVIHKHKYQSAGIKRWLELCQSMR